MLTNFKDREEGNVLFLILIAVALFAALSYAVTQSSRSGGGNAGKERAGINAAQITQYPATIRTAVVRMIIDGTDITSVEFNAPSGFGDLSNTSLGVFHPDGGGATYTQAPNTVMDSGSLGTWTFNPEFEIVNVGVSSTGAFAGNDFIAFLPGITAGICDRINDELGISGDTTLGSDASARYNAIMDDSYALPADEFIIGSVANAQAFAGQAFGCFTNSDNERVYYHLLQEQ